MGGNVSTIVSKCKAKKQGKLKNKALNLEEPDDDISNDSFFKYSTKKETIQTLQEKSEIESKKSNLIETQSKANNSLDASNLNNLIPGLNNNISQNQQMELKYRGSLVPNQNNFIQIQKEAMQNAKTVLCPNFHNNLMWLGEKRECQECETMNYGFFCDIDSYFICYKCYDYKILKTCPHFHEMKWVSNKKCFSCCEFNFCLHCEKENYSVCYKCYNYDFKQTLCPNKHEYKYFNFKSCFLCKKKNKCLGCELDDFYICLCNLNKDDDHIDPNTCSVFRSVAKFQFRSDVCILGHKLFWKKQDNTCFRCESNSNIGLFCEICEYYSHCIDCHEFKFTVLDCPNNHGQQCFKWINEKKDCLRCRKNHSGYYCNKCEYFICRKNCVGTIIRKFADKDKGFLNSNEVKNEIFLERINVNNAIFDDDKSSFIDNSFRDSRIEDLNQSNVSYSVKKQDNEIILESNRDPMKTNNSYLFNSNDIINKNNFSDTNSRVIYDKNVIPVSINQNLNGFSITENKAPTSTIINSSNNIVEKNSNPPNTQNIIKTNNLYEYTNSTTNPTPNNIFPNSTTNQTITNSSGNATAAISIPTNNLYTTSTTIQPVTTTNYLNTSSNNLNTYNSNPSTPTPTVSNSYPATSSVNPTYGVSSGNLTNYQTTSNINNYYSGNSLSSNPITSSNLNATTNYQPATSSLSTNYYQNPNNITTNYKPSITNLNPPILTTTTNNSYTPTNNINNTYQGPARSSYFPYTIPSTLPTTTQNYKAPLGSLTTAPNYQSSSTSNFNNTNLVTGTNPNSNLNHITFSTGKLDLNTSLNKSIFSKGQTNFTIFKIKILDEKYIATSGKENSLSIWNYLNGVFYKSITLDDTLDIKNLIFDSISIVNEFYIVMLYSSGSIVIYNLKNDSKPEIFTLDLNPSFCMVKINDTSFAIGNISSISIWNLRSNSIYKKINFDKIIGKVFYIEKYTLKGGLQRYLTCDEKSIKLWNRADFGFLKEIEYPQSNFFLNLNIEQKNLLSYEKILTIMKISEDKLGIFNQTLNSISLIDLEYGNSINDSKTFERKVINMTTVNQKKYFSSDNYGNLICYSEGIASLWEVDKNVLLETKADKVNDSNNSYFSSYDTVYGKCFLKKIDEMNLGKMEILDVKFLNTISFVTLSSDFKVAFWDFKK